MIVSNLRREVIGDYVLVFVKVNGKDMQVAEFSDENFSKNNPQNLMAKIFDKLLGLGINPDLCFSLVEVIYNIGKQVVSDKIKNQEAPRG